jgi:hypothetical protein
MLPFFEREPYQLNIYLRPARNEDYIKYTNLSDYKMTVLYLVNKGYGTIREIEALDTPDFLDLVEYEHIRQDIERYEIDKARRE